MLVAHGHRPGPPGLGDDLRLPGMVLGVEHLVGDAPAGDSRVDRRSEFSIETVPSSTGCPRSWASTTSSTTAPYLADSVLYTWSP